MSSGRIVQSLVVLGYVFAAGIPAILVADDWPGFLGAGRNGISTETGLRASFSESGPAVLWRRKLGVSMSGMAVDNGQVLTMYQDDAQQFVVSLDEKTGAINWRAPVAPAYENAMGNGPRATPAISGESVYVYTGDATLAAFRLADGMPQWTVNAAEAVRGRSAEYGNASSPLVIDGLVVIQVGSPSCSVAAFDAATGTLRWTSGKGMSGYSSPVSMTLCGTTQILAFTASGIAGIAPDSGNPLWSHPWPTDYDCNTACPVALGDDLVLISSGENHGSVALRVVENGGRFRATVAWESTGSESVLRAEWQTPVLHDGILYGLDNVGSAGPITNLVAVRATDGEQLWKKTRFGKSNLCLADGRLYFTNMDGQVMVGTVSADGFQETGRATVIKTTRQAPVIANARMYVRDDDEVVCLDLHK